MPTLFHFSEDPSITLFHPHVARTSAEAEPLVWAIDAEHAPSYWFPRDCPRACCWAGGKLLTDEAVELLGSAPARRMHAIEEEWLERVRSCRLFAYEFDPAPFAPRTPEAGYFVARKPVVPRSVQPVGDLLERHVAAGIGLRVVGNLWPVIDAVIASGLEFSIIRKANALPRVS